jgi:N-acetyl-gamma-glutamyl-phosphate reductase
MAVTILGASGYGGGELLRWLCGHPGVGSLLGTAHSHVDQPFHAVHPNLRGLVEGRFEAAPDWRALAGSEAPVLFSALPHGEFARRWAGYREEWQAYPGLAEKLVVVDLSADFRHADGWTYGLPEWRPERLRGATRIAAPGCFATALQLALLPLAAWKPSFVAATGATGSSGSGAAPSETTHHPTRAGDYRAYKPLAHQHEAEVLGTLHAEGWDARLAFTPHSAPMVRGIFLTVQAAIPGVEAPALRERFAAAYGNSFFVRLIDGSPRVAAVTGSAFADLGLATRDGLVSVMVALDNLGKGMAAQAVQALNLATGWPETAGLRVAGPFPG